VQNPLPGVHRALVIAGSDQRGTIYAAYDVSKGIGVSPWSWWDDVPPGHADELYVLPGRHTQGTPAVKYRGFFINDENPNLGTWAPAFFGSGLAAGYPGGFNSKFYSKIFETMLRLKANYLWPAVWGRACAEDARHRGVEPACCPGRPGQQREHHHARSRSIWRHWGVEFPAQLRCHQS